MLRSCNLLHAGTDVLCLGRHASRLGCKGAEAKDGSHFTLEGAADILAEKLEFNVFKHTKK